MYLLDTNHCSRLLDGHPAILKKLADLGDAIVTTCAIVVGELMFMAYRSERKMENLRRVQAFLTGIDIHPVDEQAADIYGQLKASILDQRGPKEKAKRRGFKIDTLGITDNDLWIAAVAKCRGLTVVSADGDFERISRIDDLAVEKWWWPELDRPPGQEGQARS